MPSLVPVTHTATDLLTPTGTDLGGGKYLTFLVGAEEYGVDILRVQEIKGWEPTTRVPNTPAFVRGVMDLRGAVVPVIDLRCVFGADSADCTKTTVVIVLRVEQGAETHVMGFVVDAVSEVYDVSGDEVQPASDTSLQSAAGYIRGFAAIDRTMVMLLDIDRLVSTTSTAAASGAAGAAATHPNPDQPIH